MKLLKVTFFVALMAMASGSGNTLHSSLTEKGEEETAIVSILQREDRRPSSSHPAGLPSVSSHLTSLTAFSCKKDPSICFKEGSPGPYCCFKQCVDVQKDHGNCGTCNHKCKNKEACCKGRCVRLPPFADCQQTGLLR